MSIDLADRTSAALRLANSLVLLLLLALFCFHWIVLAHYAIDVPYWDDWRAYLVRDAGSFSPTRLFVSSNDTLYPVGKFLDALNFKLFAGDNVIYQIISFAVAMGGLLALQYALLKRYAPTATVLGIAALSLVFMLQKGSYWGAQSIAYHQTLPLLALLGALLVVVSRVAFAAKAAMVALLTSLGGFSYISGALSGIAVASLAAAFWWRVGAGQRHEYSAATLGFGLGALLSVPAQLWVIMVVQHGKTHHPDAPWSTPLHWEFWAYIVGKVGRAIGFEATSSAFAFVASLSVAVLAVVLSLFYLWQIATQQGDPTDDQFAFIYCAICLSVVVYLGIVAAGRANLGSGPLVRNVLDFFEFGQRRFHFFWVTILIPWVVLAVMRLATRMNSPTLQTAVATTVTLLVLASIAINARTIFGHVQYYRSQADAKEQGLKCLIAKIQGPPPFLCATLYPGDLAKGLDEADLAGAKFMRYLPPFWPGAAAGRAAPSRLLWSMQESTIGKMGVVNGSAARVTAGLRIIAKQDPQVIIDVSDARSALQACHRLTVRVDLDRETPSSDAVELFYVPVGRKTFDATHSVRRRPSKNGSGIVEFQATSRAGFAPRLRLDPSSGQGVYWLRAFEVACAG